ncbi:MAG: glycosyltransferase family 4 protein [Solirubrobacterales bacterium]|nr:glycosyltransferase family 4 protein [Solirubrobacterales bacterium]
MSADVYRQRDNLVPASAPPTPEREPVGRPLRIAMLAPPWIPIPPPGYGGIEFVVQLLTDALVARGHDVELFCAPGSSSRAKVRTLLPAAHPDSIERALFEADHVARAFAAFDAAAGAGEPFDVVHDHCGYTTLAMADRQRTPVTHTVHGPFDDDTSDFYSHHARKGLIVCISHSQAAMAPPAVEVGAVAHNPIDVAAWPVGQSKQDYLLWLGRFVAEKGPQRAIDVARATGRPLILAGTVQPRHERFFATEISPHIDGEQIRFVGEVGGARKQRLFADAYAFLMPITWPEPFGMVMVESLAAGTPVIAFNHGAAPEIVEHGKTGFLVEDEQEMAAVVEQAGTIDPADCRRGAERFAPDRVAARYEAAYHAAIAAGKGVRERPRSVSPSA